MSSKKTPAWINTVKMWEIVTSVDKKERAIIVLLDALERNVKPEKAVQDSRAEELNMTDGMNIFLNKLDVVLKVKKLMKLIMLIPNLILFKYIQKWQ